MAFITLSLSLISQRRHRGTLCPREAAELNVEPWNGFDCYLSQRQREFIRLPLLTSKPLSSTYFNERGR